MCSWLNTVLPTCVYMHAKDKHSSIYIHTRTYVAEFIHTHADKHLRQPAVCIKFLDAITTVTGMQDGSLYIWHWSKLVKTINKAHAGPVFDICAAGIFLMTAGKDGKVSCLLHSLY